MQDRCAVCKKKVGLLPFTCKCDSNHKFCIKHRFDHNCTYDYQKEQQEKLLKENPKIEAPKIKVI